MFLELRNLLGEDTFNKFSYMLITLSKNLFFTSGEQENSNAVLDGILKIDATMADHV